MWSLGEERRTRTRARSLGEEGERTRMQARSLGEAERTRRTEKIMTTATVKSVWSDRLNEYILQYRRSYEISFQTSFKRWKHLNCHFCIDFKSVNAARTAFATYETTCKGAPLRKNCTAGVFLHKVDISFLLFYILSLSSRKKSSKGIISTAGDVRQRSIWDRWQGEATSFLRDM